MRYLVVPARRREEESQGRRSDEASEEDDGPDDGVNPFLPINQQLVTAQVKTYCVCLYAVH